RQGAGARFPRSRTNLLRTGPLAKRRRTTGAEDLPQARLRAQATGLIQLTAAPQRTFPAFRFVTDPNVRLLRIEPHRAELWDGPASTAVTLFELAKAWLTGTGPALGENRKVTVNM